MNLATMLILLALCLVIALIVRKLIGDKRNGRACAGCSGNCAGCSCCERH